MIRQKPGCCPRETFWTRTLLNSAAAGLVSRQQRYIFDSSSLAIGVTTQRWRLNLQVYCKDPAREQLHRKPARILARAIARNKIAVRLARCWLQIPSCLFHRLHFSPVPLLQLPIYPFVYFSSFDIYSSEFCLAADVHTRFYPNSSNVSCFTKRQTFGSFLQERMILHAACSRVCVAKQFRMNHCEMNHEMKSGLSSTHTHLSACPPVNCTEFREEWGLSVLALTSIGIQTFLQSKTGQIQRLHKKNIQCLLERRQSGHQS